jgi:hypothetical protein
MKENLVVSKPRGEDQLSEDLIREELSRILESSLFAQSDRLGRFLRFTVETTLAGEAYVVKEYLIGTEVYERNSSYHPSEDSIVRSEARRLRSKLKEYYGSVGKYDPVHIYYRPGSYVSAFRPRPTPSPATRSSLFPSESRCEMGHLGPLLGPRADDRPRMP